MPKAKKVAVVSAKALQHPITGSQQSNNSNFANMYIQQLCNGNGGKPAGNLVITPGQPFVHINGVAQKRPLPSSPIPNLSGSPMSPPLKLSMLTTAASLTLNSNGTPLLNGTSMLNEALQANHQQLSNHAYANGLMSSQAQSQASNGLVTTNGSIAGHQPSILKCKQQTAAISTGQASANSSAVDCKSSSPMLINSDSADYSDKFSDFTLLAATAAAASQSMNGSSNSSFDQGSVQHTPSSKRRKTESKNSKGLRHFSMKVGEKVKVKGITTYNEVADELVSEFTADASAAQMHQSGFDSEPFDQKNIRRRVYDALNVLMAMNIISKEKKEIRWVGLPNNCTQECFELEREKKERLKRIQLKKQQLRDLLLQQIAFKNLVERNKAFDTPPNADAVIQLPFIIVNTDKQTVIDCSISNDKSEYLFNFDNTFEIHDDIEVLKRIGLACGLEREMSYSGSTGKAIAADNQGLDRKKLDRIRSLLPEALRSELDEMIEEKLQQQKSALQSSSKQQPQSSQLSISSSTHSELVVENDSNSDIGISSYYSIASATN